MAAGEASSKNTLIGRWGAFMIESDLVARTTEWSVNKKLANVAEWGDSDSRGFTNRRAGRKDATFTANGKYDTDEDQLDLFQPEDCTETYLYLAKIPTYGTNPYAVTDLRWHFPRALCNDFSMAVNIDTEEVIGWTSAWGADGQFYFPGEAEPDGRTPNLPA